MKPMTCKTCGHKFHIKKDNREQWDKNYKLCPSCNVKYCTLPKGEKILHELQDLYYRNDKKEEYLVEMIKYLIGYAKNIIKKYYIKKVSGEEEIRYYAENAVSYFIEDCYYKKDEYIYASFAGMLRPRVIYVLYGKNEKPSEHETLDYVLEDGHTAAYQHLSDKELKKDMLKEMQRNYETKNLFEDITTLIYEISNYCRSEKENYIRLLNIYHYLDKGEKVCDNFFSIGYDKEGKEMFLKTLSILKNELTRLYKSTF